MQDLLSFAWSMSQSPLPGMPAAASQGSRGICTSCGGGTYRGRTTCSKCLTAQQHQRRIGICGTCGGVTYKGKLTCTKCERLARSQHVACWICGKQMANRPRADGLMPTCGPCNREHGNGICTECGGPMRVGSRTAAPPDRRRCSRCRMRPRDRGPRICELCEEAYVPKWNPRPGTQQRFCSKSCTRAWQNGARPPYTRQADIGDAAMRKKARCRARHLRHAQTWDGITDEEILERDGWRCQIPGCKRRPIRKDAAYPHPRSKSIDHIVPLSLGGDDTAVNKRAAHLGCNLARSNRVGFEQTALFGVIKEPPLTTRTAGAATVRARRPCQPCKCGAQKQPGSLRCDACQRHLDEAKARRQEALEAKRIAVEDRLRQLDELHSGIRKLRAQGFTTRATAAYLGTSQRMVTRVEWADPVTGKLPR